MDLHIDAYDLEYDYVLLSNAEQGWIIEVCGQLGMDTVRRVAENLEIRETGNTLTQAGFSGTVPLHRRRGRLNRSGISAWGARFLQKFIFFWIFKISRDFPEELKRFSKFV